MMCYEDFSLFLLSSLSRSRIDSNSRIRSRCISRFAFNRLRYSSSETFIIPMSASNRSLSPRPSDSSAGPGATLASDVISGREVCSCGNALASRASVCACNSEGGEVTVSSRCDPEEADASIEGIFREMKRTRCTRASLMAS